MAASTKVARSQMFNGTLSKVTGFVIACKTYIKMKIREVLWNALNTNIFLFLLSIFLDFLFLFLFLFSDNEEAHDIAVT